MFRTSSLYLKSIDKSFRSELGGKMADKDAGEGQLSTVKHSPSVKQNPPGMAAIQSKN